MSPDGLRGGEAGGDVGGRAVVEDRHPLDPPAPSRGRGGRPKVPDTVRKRGAAELALHGLAHSAPGDERCYVPYYGRHRMAVRSHSSPGRGARDQITSKSIGRWGRIFRNNFCHPRYIL